MACTDGREGAAEGDTQQMETKGDTQQMETDLTSMVDGLGALSLDLNVSQHRLRADFERMIALRGQLLEAYGVPSGPAPCNNVVRPSTHMMAKHAHESGQKRKADNQNPGEVVENPKQVLTKLVKVLAGVPVVQREDIVYETCQQEDKRWISSVTIPGFNPSEGHLGEPADNKRMAEVSAASAAVAALAPIAESILEDDAAKKAASQFQKKLQKKQVSEHPKCLLASLVRVFVGERSVQKQDVVYETCQQEDLSWICSVTIPEFNPTEEFCGEPSENRKTAEASAASAAIAAVEPVARPILEERREERRVQKAAGFAQKKNAKAAKKANMRGLNPELPVEELLHPSSLPSGTEELGQAEEDAFTNAFTV